ncbi:MAG: dienelactone hydrolase family protein [Dehalococcoidia bacterium]|nr:dienelactone hydrolase family protein [Dehalococcoidia bacterium]
MAGRVTTELLIETTDAELPGDLVLPRDSDALIVFAHGSGSSRRSGRNRQVAAALEGAGFGTLLFDLLTLQEEAVDQQTAEFRFDIPLIGRRMMDVVDWLERAGETAGLEVGLFGASTGAAAALIAAGERPRRVSAVVSRGGRPDLAVGVLDRVEAPTLLIVGERDSEVIRLNEMARSHMRALCELEIVPGATHLFEEPGALDHVAVLATSWFQRHM